MVDVFAELLEALERHETVALATVLTATAPGLRPGMKLLVREGGAASGSLVGQAIAAGIREDCLAAIREGRETQVVRYDGEPAQTADVYIELHRSPPVVVIVGAGHVGLHVARFAKAVGFKVVVVDDRPTFANADRFPDARVLVGEIGETLADIRVDGSTYVVLVTRGHAQDEDALRQVIGSGAAYVGMIGSKARVRAVKEGLHADGFSRELLEGLHSPIGLPIGAETPEEIALSIVAEMVSVRRLGGGVRHVVEAGA